MPIRRLPINGLRTPRRITLIHGHTHRPAEYALPAGRTRVVLSDWHCDGPAHAPRCCVLRPMGNGSACLWRMLFSLFLIADCAYI